MLKNIAIKCMGNTRYVRNGSTGKTGKSKLKEAGQIVCEAAVVGVSSFTIFFGTLVLLNHKPLKLKPMSWCHKCEKRDTTPQIAPRQP